MATQEEVGERVIRDLRWEKLLIIEGLACQGKFVLEKGQEDKALERLKRINNEVKQLNLLFKYNPNEE